MKRYDLLDAIGNADDEFVKETKEKKKPRKAVWLKWSAAVVACLVLVMAIPMALNFFNLGGGDNGAEGVIHNGVFSVEDLNRPYKDINISVTEATTRLWRWEERPVYEQYTEFKMDGIEFIGRSVEIDADKVGEKIGKQTLTGYASHPNDFPEGPRYKMFEVYEIKSVSSDSLVAVLMEGKYYAFIGDRKPPATFGEVLDKYGLVTVLELSRFTKNDMGKDEGYYQLTDDAYIWEVLSSCRDAKKTDTDNWNRYERNYISFTVTSDALGVYKHAMYITDDGYLWTNAFDYAHLYNIGTDAAEKIISYAMSNSTEAKSEPYRRAIVGTIVEITDEYMLVNDGVLCENPEEGISFKIMLNDVRISRYITSGAVKLNETVKIEYEGKIDVDNGYVIYDAISANEAIIGGNGDVLIPE